MQRQSNLTRENPIALLAEQSAGAQGGRMGRGTCPFPSIARYRARPRGIVTRRARFEAHPVSIGSWETRLKLTLDAAAAKCLLPVSTTLRAETRRLG